MKRIRSFITNQIKLNYFLYDKCDCVVIEGGGELEDWSVLMHIGLETTTATKSISHNHF